MNLREKKLNKLDAFMTSDGIEYRRNEWGGFTQKNPQRFRYDRNYNSTYDTAEYKAAASRLNEIRCEAIYGAMGEPASLIDIGFGNGSFLKMAQEYFNDTTLYGFDIAQGYRPERGDRWRRVDSYTGRKYTVACFWDSLEHMHHMDILADVKADAVAVSMPYFAFHDHTVAEFEEWHHRKPNEHIQFHNMASLGTLLRNFGYTEGLLFDWCEDEVRHPKAPFQHNIMTAIFRKEVI